MTCHGADRFSLTSALPVRLCWVLPSRRAVQTEAVLTARLMSSDSIRPIIIVTGANGCVPWFYLFGSTDRTFSSGLGFGICHRLLFQLSSSQCEDAIPKYAFHNASDILKELPPRCDGLTLILACRSRQRAEAAKQQLYDLLDQHIAQLQRLPHYDGHAEKFRRNLVIAIHTVDLAHVRSIFNFADEVAQTLVSSPSAPVSCSDLMTDTLTFRISYAMRASFVSQGSTGQYASTSLLLTLSVLLVPRSSSSKTLDV